MSFLSPLFLLGALAAAVPIVLHLLRKEPDTTVKFAAVTMLEDAPVEHADRRRLRELLLLALRVAALLLLALAFARPFLTSDAAGAATGATIVALDTSFSLSAPGRFAAAQALARAAIDDAPGEHLVGVVTFADGAQVVQAPTVDRTLARAAIDGARAGFGATRYRAALATAADSIGGRAGRVVVVTDLQASGWDSGERVDVPAQVELEIADVGVLPANLAVTAARRSGDRIVATVRNGGNERRDVRLHLEIDGVAAADAAATAGAGQTVDVAIPLPTPTGNAATLILDDSDGIPADDRRYLVLSESSRPVVLVVTNAGDIGRDAFYAQQALLATGADGASFDLDGASGAQLSGWDTATLARHAAVLLLSTHGIDQRGRELLAAYVRGGGGVLVAASPDVDAQVAAGATGTAIDMIALPPAPAGAPRVLAPADLRHPVFRAFSSDAATLGLVTFRQVVAVRGTGCQPLAQFSSGEPALIECPSGEGRVLVLASDLDSRWNDFPTHATFVPFLHETVTYLGGNRSRTAGFVIGSAPVGVPAEPGHRVLPAADGGQERLIAVNIDGRESDPARLTADEFRAAVVPLQQEGRAPGDALEARQQEEQQNFWRYAILLMIAVLVAESLVGARAA